MAEASPVRAAPVSVPNAKPRKASPTENKTKRKQMEERLQEDYARRGLLFAKACGLLITSGTGAREWARGAELGEQKRMRLRTGLRRGASRRGERGAGAFTLF